MLYQTMAAPASRSFFFLTISAEGWLGDSLEIAWVLWASRSVGSLMPAM